MDRVNPDDVRRLATNTVTDLNSSPLISDLVSRVLDGETVVLEVEAPLDLFNWPATEETSYFERDETFYEISSWTLDRGTVTGPEYAVSLSEHLPETVSDEDVASFSALPSQDRWRLHDALVLSEYTGEIVSADSFVAGYLDSDLREGSRLASGIDRRFVEFDGRYLELTERGTETAPAVRHRYSAAPVATDVDSFADHIAAQRAVESSDLSPAAQDLVTNLAAEGEVDICHTVSGGESDRIDEADESERRAITELQSYTDATKGSQTVYIRHDGDEYALDWSHSTSAV